MDKAKERTDALKADTQKRKGNVPLNARQEDLLVQYASQVEEKVAHCWKRK